MDQKHGDDGQHAAWLVRAGLFLATLSSTVAVCRGAAAGDVASVAFVVAIYVTLLLLLVCLRAYERAPPAGGADGRRERIIRRAVWALSTLLTVMFASRVAAVMPYWPAVLLVWALATVTTVAGFVAIFRRP